MITKIEKWGDKQILCISSEILQNANINVGDEVEVEVHHGVLHVTPIQKMRQKYNLEDLIDQLPGNYKPEELDWGKPSGKEIW